jgi:adhesin transport system membrane fusion protein
MPRASIQDADLDYVNDPREVLARGTPRRARSMLWVTILFIAAAIGWASVAEVDEVTKGTGKVIPSRQIQVVQNLEGGIVSEIMVREGQIVDPGQVLLRIDDTRFSSTFREREVSKTALEARLARLKAEAEGTAFSPSAKLLEAAAASVERERALFVSQQQELASQIAVFEQQATQKRQEADELRARLAGLRANQRLLNSELDLTRPLVAKGAVSEVEVLRLERKAIEVRTEIDATRLALPRVESALEEIQNRIASAKISFRNDAREEFNALSAELASLSESAVALEDRVKRTLVRAPVHGTVNRLLINTVGGVVQPGSDLVEIVPLEDSLLVEAQIRPADTSRQRSRSRHTIS